MNKQERLMVLAVTAALTTTAAYSQHQLELSTLNGEEGSVIFGSTPDRAGFSVSDAGDVNGDGVGDMIVGAPSADTSGSEDSGRSYVVFGRSGLSAASIDLGSLNGSNGFSLSGADVGDESGARVRSAGDVNGDGIEDLIIGARLADQGANADAGEAYVVFGSSTGFAANIDRAGWQQRIYHPRRGG